MCGLVGSFRISDVDLTRPNENDLLRLAHRGPDGDGLYVDSDVRLGHTRLAILDLTAAASQPMFSTDKRFAMVFNGEIYNYLELRDELGMPEGVRSDSEVLLEAFQRWGRECLVRLIGMFAFAIWDSQNEELFLARDRLGEKPLYISRNRSAFYFASEIKSILGMIGGPHKIDAESIDCFLHYQYVPEPRTLVDGVTKLPAGHFMVISRENFDSQPIRYWSIEDTHQDGQTLNRANYSDISDALEKSVELCLRSDVPVGIALSGGIDSSIIAAMAQKHSGTPLHAFSIGYPGRPAYDERDKARKLADELGMIFHEVEIPVDSFVEQFPELIRSMDEPIADPAAFGHYSIPKAVADSGIKVLLSGLGSDEIFWGYDWVRKAMVQNFKKNQSFSNRVIGDATLRLLSFFEKRGVVKGRFGNYLRIKHADLFRLVDSWTPDSQLNFYINEQQFRQAFEFKKDFYGSAMNDVTIESLFRPTEIGSRNKQQVPAAYIRMLMDTWFVSNCLTLSDRVSMRFGVETRLPFANHNLIEMAMAQRSLEPDHYQGNKSMLRKSVSKWLPKEIVDRTKAGFQPPVTQWLQEVINKYSVLLENGVLQSQHLVKPEVNMTLMKKYSRQGWPQLFYAYKIVLLEVWLREVLYEGNH